MRVANNNQTANVKGTAAPKKSLFQRIKVFLFGPAKEPEKSKDPYKNFVEVDNTMLEKVFKFEIKNDGPDKFKSETQKFMEAKLKETEEFINSDGEIQDLKSPETNSTVAAKTILPSKNTNAPKREITDNTSEFSKYIPSDPVKYSKVLEAIIKNKNLLDKSRAVGIANMVCAISDKYQIDPEITAHILGAETGGYQFTKRVMVHDGSRYKGVMQVDFDNIKSIYADVKDANNMNLSEHERRLAYDHRHFAKDQARIDELKKKYPTPESLYEAIQYDVALGVEVGIMAYKAKLSMSKGNTRLALSRYCGDQYKLPADSTVAERIYPIPSYIKEA